MSLFSFLININNTNKSSSSDPGWIQTSARFTGKFEPTSSKTKGSMRDNYNSYELVYMADGEQKHGWYSFYPLPDPDPEQLADTTMQIKYKENKPYLFEPVFDEQL